MQTEEGGKDSLRECKGTGNLFITPRHTQEEEKDSSTTISRSASLRTVVLLPYSCFPVHCNSSGLSPPWVINICREVKEEESAIQHHASSQGLLKVRGGPARCLPGSRARPPARLPGVQHNNPIFVYTAVS
uniref:uncharacterized protein LOC118519013 n=1 Tax=Halichoerus grypus TaxID=9711 RepID=UPI001658EFDC|nr:uncharacterized protein LOC118519013 [Halichoerus grypus]